MLALLAPLALASTRSQLIMGLGYGSGDLIPVKLPHPEQWVYLGMKGDSSAIRQMLWIKPLDAMPRTVAADQPVVQPSKEQFFKPLQEPTQTYTESFEYLGLRRKKGDDPKTWLEQFTLKVRQDCPSAVVNVITQTSSELEVELKATGCPPHADQVEIDRFIFVRDDLFSIYYRVNASEMTAEQRETGLMALNAWAAH